VVQFEPRGDATEVIVVHERIPNVTTRDRHQQGWDRMSRWAGQLLESRGKNKLAEFLSDSASVPEFDFESGRWVFTDCDAPYVLDILHFALGGSEYRRSVDTFDACQARSHGSIVHRREQREKLTAANRAIANCFSLWST
jgi:hypothetical protein